MTNSTNVQDYKKHDRRKTEHFDEKKAYKALTLKRAMERERRADTLEKLVEIRDQRKMYFIVLSLCVGLNVFLLLLGFIGLGK